MDNAKQILFKTFLLLVMGSLYAMPACCQEKEKEKEKDKMFRDTLDGKLDFSRFIIEAKGFLPMAFIITEPALGNIGLAAAPMFLSPKKSSNPNEYVPPDVTIGAAMYTANNSFGVGGAHIGSLPKAGLKYRFGVFYGDINLDFYPTIGGEEKELNFNVKALPFFGSISKKITRNDIYLGLNYVFMPTKLTPNFDGDIPVEIPEKDLKNNAAALGVFLDWDKRNSIFTPDKGFRINTEYSINDNWTGSDYEYQRLVESINWFIPIRPNWISGLRLEGQHVFGEPPFYLLPGIRLRGIPAARYQGQSTVLVETEQRYDFALRWSGLVFGGVGKAIKKDESFGDAKTVYNAGAGFRYLVARAFKIRAGVDVAVGPGSWGYYIVFGHNWNR